MNIILIILCHIIGWILGSVITIKLNDRKTYGEIIIDHATNNFNIRLNSIDLENPKLKKIELKVLHNKSSALYSIDSQEKQVL